MRPKNSGNNNGNRGHYRYSYAMNDLIRTPVRSIGWPSGAGATPTGWKGTQRSWGPGDYKGKLNNIKTPAQIIMYVCEDEQTIDDGVFAASPWNWNATSGTLNMVASRHETKFRSTRGNVSGFTQLANQDARGNVAFCDGHAEFMSRVDAIRSRHSGNPYPDPTGYPF